MLGTRQSLPARDVRSLRWEGETLVDWVSGGMRYGLDGSVTDPHVRYAYRFDAAQVSPSGRFAVIYERLGTKGLVLREGGILREINRSFYHASTYDYPLVLFTLPDGREGLAHCPEEYNRLEVELLETGERLTGDRCTRAADLFHSRLAVDPTGSWLMSAGWIWHPFDTLSLYSIPEALVDPTLLDRLNDFPERSVEITTAVFAPAGRLVVTSQAAAEDFRDEDEETPEGTILPGFLGVYDLAQCHYLSLAPLHEEVGVLMPVGPEHVLGFYQRPKLIHTATGRVLYRWTDLDTGNELSSISWHRDPLPPLALDSDRRRFAVAGAEEITVITLPQELPV